MKSVSRISPLMLLRASRDPEGPAAPAKTTSIGRRRPREESTAPGANLARGTQSSKEPRRKRRLRLLLPVVVLTVMAFLYYRPLSSYLADPARARRAAGAGRRSAGGEGAARAAARPHDERRRARPRGPADRLRQARRAALHRQGHRRLAAPASAATSSSRGRRPLPCRRGGPRRRRAPDRTAPPRLPSRGRALPLRRPRRDRAEPVRRRGRAVPDHLLPHLPSPGGGRLPARGGRRRRALERRRRGEPGADRRSRRRDGAAAASPARARRRPHAEPTTAPRSTPGIGGSRNPVAAEVPPRPRRVRARQSGLPHRGARPRRDPRAVGPPTAAARKPRTTSHERRPRQRPARLGGRESPLRARVTRPGARPSA